jgi:hypothetical protein
VESELITIPAGRVLLRPLRAEEIDAEWAAVGRIQTFVPADRVEGRTDPRNHPMQRVFRRLGWVWEGVVPDGGREWLLSVAPRP